MIGILIMPSENLWPEFFQRTCSLLRFLDQLLGFSRLLDFIESKFDFSSEIKKLLNGSWETLAPGAPADTQEAAHRDGAETPEVSTNTTLALLQAERDSVVKSMSDLVKVKDEEKITPYVKDPESSGEVDVAKEQLDVLVKIQHDLKRQQVVQQALLRRNSCWERCKRLCRNC